MKSIQDQVLDLFKDEISTRLDKNWKEIPLELDYDLFDAPGLKCSAVVCILVDERQYRS